MFEALKKLWNKDPSVTEKPIVVKTNISDPVDRDWETQTQLH